MSRPKLKTLPMLPFYPADYLAGTRYMTLAERGAYTDLLFIAWNSGNPLPKDATRLARLVGCTPKEFKRIWPAVCEKFVDTPDGYINERLEAERTNALRIRDRAAENGKKGADKRWPGHGHPIAPPSPPYSQPTAPPSPGDSTLSLSLSPIETPLTPHRGDGNAKARSGRKSRELRSQSLSAWRQATAAIDEIRKSDLTWAEVSKRLKDPVADKAIERTGGHKVIADRINGGSTLESRFREAYEQIVSGVSQA